MHTAGEIFLPNKTSHRLFWHAENSIATLKKTHHHRYDIFSDLTSLNKYSLITIMHIYTAF